MAKKIDYEFKSYVLREHADLLKKQRQASQYDYAVGLLNDYGIITYSVKRGEQQSVNDLMNEAREQGLMKEFVECRKLNEASYKRTARLKERVKTMLLNGSCIFLTLTFTDDVLSSTTEKQRRVAVSRYLKQYNAMYVANIDFGSKNHREHYHALINCERVDNQSWLKYGSIDFERVRNRDIERDNVKLSKYIAKLSNHAIKETTRRSVLMYSR